MTLEMSPERPPEYADIRHVVGLAFPTEPEVVDLVERVRASDGYVPSLTLCARLGSEVVGFVMLSNAALVDEEGVAHGALVLSPLAVKPDRQGQGIGSALVHASLAAAEQTDAPMVVLEGSPGYYSRFGFSDCRTFGVHMRLPDWAPENAGQAFLLPAYTASVRGRLLLPAAFAVLP